MFITVKKLIVDGVELPTPELEGVNISSNPIWASNTGRLQLSGTMVGTIITTKAKLEIKWPDLTIEKAQIIADVATTTAEWHTLEYTDLGDIVHTLTVYFGEFTYTQTDNRKGGRIIRNAQISAIER